MFENVLSQPGAQRLAEDIRAGTLPSSILFIGPPSSGKGTAALELARALSCLQGAADWDCACSSCALHRTLSHQDVLLLGSRNFSAEIGASAAAFLRESESSARLLFLRAAKKLLARFSSTAWEGEEAKLGKLSVHISAVLDAFDELDGCHGDKDGQRIAKYTESIIQNTNKLISDGIGDYIPVGHIRRASYWMRMTPVGKRKVLIVENADRMQDSARNGLLKILEEPPENSSIVLTTSRKGAILPTILSRVRPYVFTARDVQAERDVLRRVFRDAEAAERLSGARTSASAGGIEDYLNTFLPVSPETLRQAAAFYIASIAAQAVRSIRACTHREPPAGLIALGRSAARISDASPFGRPVLDQRKVSAAVLRAAGSFELPRLFSLFLNELLTIASPSLNDGALGIDAPVLASAWKRAVAEADAAVHTYNQSPALALDRLFFELSEALASLFGDRKL
jgi:DNA polymerase-3 subunit gamma/tau